MTQHRESVDGLIVRDPFKDEITETTEGQSHLETVSSQNRFRTLISWVKSRVMRLVRSADSKPPQQKQSNFVYDEIAADLARPLGEPQFPKDDIAQLVESAVNEYVSDERRIHEAVFLPNDIKAVKHYIEATAKQRGWTPRQIHFVAKRIIQYIVDHEETLWANKIKLGRKMQELAEEIY